MSNRDGDMIGIVLGMIIGFIVILVRRMVQ